MLIKLKVNSLVAALGRQRALEVVPEIIHRDDFQNIALDITKVSKEEVDKIAKVSETDNRGLSRRLNMWKDLRADPDSVKIKNSVQLETALIEFVRRLPHHLLFMRADDGQVLPWYVNSITWHKKERHRGYSGEIYYTPAYCMLRVCAYRDEAVVNASFNWNDDMLGAERRTVSDLLEEAELFPEKEKSYGTYETELKRFFDTYKLTGKQFNAFGRCEAQGKSDWWGSRTVKVRSLTKDGKPTRVVIDWNGDEEPDEEDDKSVAKGTVNGTFWKKYDLLDKPVKVDREDDDDDGEAEEVDEQDDNSVVLPVHPYLQVFDFDSDDFIKCHINCLQEYEWAPDIQKKLILPSDTKELVSILIETATNIMDDIVSGKTGGVIVMSTGEPGTGKTLTAEVFAEQIKIPIYMVQCSQLGITHEQLEKELIIVLKRAMRWNALLLLDEADVYTRTRENDIQQNAIVGVFLRLLERYRGVLFMTSNRATAIDDAIMSRCIAHIKYELPSEDQSKLIWEVLADNYQVDLFPKEIAALAKEFPMISGRNIKTLLKLAVSVSKKKEYKKGEIADLIRKVCQFVDFPKAHYDLKQTKGRKG
jgi:hypothetical protein